MLVFTKFDKLECRCAEEEVGQPWEPRWGMADYEQGLCHEDKVGTLRTTPDTTPEDPAEPTGPHRLLVGLDPDHPDTDRAILRRLYHKDPEKFLDSYGTAGINKLMDIAVKEERPDKLPPVGDVDAWQKIGADVVKMVERCDSPGQVASIPLMLYVFVKAKCDPVAALETFAEAEATRQGAGA